MSKTICECGGLRDTRAKHCKKCWVKSERANPRKYPNRKQPPKKYSPRICQRCETSPATNRSGVGLCDTCRSNPIMRERICTRCGYEFCTSSGNNICVSCQRSHNGFDNCPDCSGKKDKRAQRCSSCAGVFRRGASPRWRISSTECTLRRKNSHGYIDVKVPNWPTAVRGWIREHRYVMELDLGRSLSSDESVHHKNGIKDDNRIENLELWCVNQPIGQRVEDLLNWADELIKRYR